MTCNLPGCTNECGEQDRDDYKQRSYCSVQCEVKADKLRDAAREARKRPHDRPDEPGGIR